MKKIDLIYFVLLLIPINSYAKKTICEQYPPNYVTAVLVDVSEPLNRPSQMIFEKLAQKIITDSPNSSRIDIYKIGSGSNTNLEPELSLCKPPENNNSLFSGKIFLKNKMQKEFINPLSKELKSLSIASTSSQESPILETFFSISIKSFINQSGQQIPGKVIVISDFMQNSELLNFYKQEIPTYKDFKASSNGRSWVRNFAMVSFEAVVIPRNDTSKLPIKGRDFFIGYFADNVSCWQWRDLSSSIPPGKCK